MHIAPPAPPALHLTGSQLAEGKAPPSSSHRHRRKSVTYRTACNSLDCIFSCGSMAAACHLTKRIKFSSEDRKSLRVCKAAENKPGLILISVTSQMDSSASAFQGSSPSHRCVATGRQLHISLSSGSWHAAGFTYSLEGLFPSVRPDVIVERCSTSKGSAAVTALERSVTGVCDDVVPQLRGLGEGLGAVTTLVGPAEERGTPGCQFIPWSRIKNHVGRSAQSSQ